VTGRAYSVAGMYDFLLTVHVLAAVLWVGGGVTLHILLRRALALSDPDAQHARFTELEWVGERFYPVFSVLLIAAAIWLVADDDGRGWEFSDTFIQIGFTGWIISFLIGIGFYGREGKKRAGLVESEGAASPSVAASFQRTAIVNSFELLILLVVVVDMTTKPGWP
jgi:uncharacterized membrane protein